MTKPVSTVPASARLRFIITSSAADEQLPPEDDLVGELLVGVELDEEAVFLAEAPVPVSDVGD
jgi:hypothetical protein